MTKDDRGGSESRIYDMMYLTEVPSQNREDVAVRRLLGTPFLIEGLFEPLKIHPEIWWAITKVSHERLVSDFSGDTDIILGRLTLDDPTLLPPTVDRCRERYPGAHPGIYGYFAALELAEAGGLKWPPSLDYLVAIETKCFGYDHEERAHKSQKSSYSKVNRIRRQVDLLADMGFDRAVLLEFIPNPPATGARGHAWLEAAEQAHRSVDEVGPILAQRLAIEAPAGHVVVSWGTVAGGDETERGAGAPQWLREARENPRLADPVVRGRREELERNLREILDTFPRPRRFPALLLEDPRVPEV